MRHAHSSGRPTSGRRAASALLAAVLACASGCAELEAPAPVWLDLTRGFQPSIEGKARYWADEDGVSSPVVADESGEGMWLEQALDADSWESLPGGVWKRMRPRSFIARTALNAVVELTGPAGEVKRVWPKGPGRGSDDVHFWITARGELNLHDARLEAPPANMVLREYVERGSEVDGRRRVIVGDVTAFGLDLWPGETADREVRYEGDATLRFVTTAAASKAGTHAIFIVRCDDGELFRFEQAVDANVRSARAAVAHSVPLPAPSDGTLRLTFAVQGDADAAAFLEPIVGPRHIGTYAERPWDEDLPDLILFSADTMRADSLAAYGGKPSRTPNLNRLAESSVRFLNARSPSSWTLPAHASMWTGLFPDQHGARKDNQGLADEAVTLAEHFARFGYRTGAITDGVFVSRSYGIDQGFSWFEEHDGWDSGSIQSTPHLERTLRGALEFLDRDDGRPILLFVHTYRTHTPYRTGPEEDPTTNYELMRLAADRLRDDESDNETSVVLGDLVDRYRELYYEGVTQLDTAFAPFWEQVTERGIADTGIFCFLSDHGEAFYEHDERGHHKLPHEEQIRVPLLLRAPELEPKNVEWAVSLVDLPQTFAELARIPPAPEWGGRSLLGITTDEPVFSARHSDWTVIDGTKKVFFEISRRSEITEAYDLESDPLETENVAESAGWPKEMVSAFADEIERLHTLRLNAAELELSSEMRERLDELGYGGE